MLVGAPAPGPREKSKMLFGGRVSPERPKKAYDTCRRRGTPDEQHKGECHEFDSSQQCPHPQHSDILSRGHHRYRDYSFAIE